MYNLSPPARPWNFFNAGLLNSHRRIPSHGLQHGPGAPKLIEPLTRREIGVLHLIEAGLSNKEIAAVLVISPATVKKHTANIYGKMGVNRRTQAVALGRKLQII